MNIRTISLFTALLLGGSATAQTAQKLETGKEQVLTVPKVPGPVQVFLPSNYDPHKAWPVIFYYHGLNGQPETTTMRTYTGGLDYIVVGMEYIQRGLNQRTPEETLKYAYAEVKNLHTVLGVLSKSAHLDSKRIYLVGLSKGGWLVGPMLELDQRFAGAAILLAGRPRNLKLVKPETIRDKPIYVGVGEKDGNNAHARRAAEFYGRWKAKVTLEEFPGLGHEMSPNPVLFRDWLSAMGSNHLGPRDPQTQKRLGVWYKNRWEALEKLKTPEEAYNAMVRFANSPLLDQCIPQAVAKVEQRLEAMRQVDPFRSEWRAEQEFHHVLYQESKIQSLKDMEKVLNSYKEIAARYPDTIFGKRSFDYGKAVAEAFIKSKDATARQNPAPPPPETPTSDSLKPSFPSDRGRTVPRPPNQSGNTIRF